MRLIIGITVLVFAVSLAAASCTSAIGTDRPQPAHSAEEIDVPGGHNQGGGATL
ncbi:MAG: hypothetical protein HRF49_05800 [bacterium]|jgi:hypothetical protein